MKSTSKWRILILAAAAAVCFIGCDSGSDNLGGGGPAPVTVQLTAGADTIMRGNLTGGSLSRDVCPEDQMLIGLSGSSPVMGWIHHLEAICGIPSVVGAGGNRFRLNFAAGSTLEMRGRVADPTFERTCPDDRVLVGFRGRSGLLVDRLTLQCARVIYMQDGGGGWMHQIEDVLDLDPAGGTGGSEFDQTNCPAGQVARGANIRHGDGIDAFGMICATPEPVDIE